MFLMDRHLDQRGCYASDASGPTPSKREGKRQIIDQQYPRNSSPGDMRQTKEHQVTNISTSDDQGSVSKKISKKVGP